MKQADAKAEEKGLNIPFGLILLRSESGGCESRREGGNKLYKYLDNSYHTTMRTNHQEKDRKN